MEFLTEKEVDKFFKEKMKQFPEIYTKIPSGKGGIKIELPELLYEELLRIADESYPDKKTPEEKIGRFLNSLKHRCYFEEVAKFIAKYYRKYSPFSREWKDYKEKYESREKTYIFPILYVDSYKLLIEMIGERNFDVEIYRGIIYDGFFLYLLLKAARCYAVQRH